MLSDRKLSYRAKFQKGIRFLIARGMTKISSSESYLDWSTFVYKKYYYRTTDVAEYSYMIDPIKVIWIDPSKIDRFTNRPGEFWHNKPSQIGQIKSGNWDIGGDLFDDMWINNSFRKHFENGKEWKTTEIYDRWAEDQSISYANKMGEYYDGLFKQIKNEGYKTQIELVKSGDQPIRSLPYLLTNEITVDVGRNGDLLLVDTKHRLSIAQILNLEQVPVFILNRHKKWVDEIKRKSQQHPDIEFPESSMFDCD